MLILIGTSFTSTAVKLNNISVQYRNQGENSNPSGIPINRKYFIAQLSGEINISETCNYRKSIIPDIYWKIELNGTVSNSTLLDPFAIWPPISWIPFLRMVFLPNDSPVHLNITLFKGKFYTKDNGTKVRFYGEGYLININAIILLNKNIHTIQR
jgi:hypothetical protein